MGYLVLGLVWGWFDLIWSVWPDLAYFGMGMQFSHSAQVSSIRRTSSFFYKLSSKSSFLTNVLHFVNVCAYYSNGLVF